MKPKVLSDSEINARHRDVSRRDAITWLLGATTVGIGAAALSPEDAASAFEPRLPVQQCVPTIADLRALRVGAPGRNINCVSVLGYHQPGDSGGGPFWFDAGATESDNDGTLIKLDAVPAARPGRWRRIVPGDSLSVKWFGAKGNGTIDDRPAITGAQTAVVATGGALYFPSGAYRIATTRLELNVPVRFAPSARLIPDSALLVTIKKEILAPKDSIIFDVSNDGAFEIRHNLAM